MISASPSTAFETVVQGFPTGLTGTVGVQVIDNIGGVAIARVTAGIAERPTGSGIYTATLTAPATAGQYTVVWDKGTITPSTTATEDLVVTYTAATIIAPTGSDLCTLADVRQSLELPAAETTRDALISNLIPVASQMICTFVEREFAPVSTATRRFKIDGRMAYAGIVELAPYDLQSATLVSLNPELTSPSTLVAGTDYVLSPVTTDEGVYTSLRLSGFLSVVSSTLVRFGYALVDVTGTWGFPTVPTQVKEACSDAVSAWLRRDVSQLGLNLQDGSNLSPDFFASFDLPISAIRKINPYRRNSGAY